MNPQHPTDPSGGFAPAPSYERRSTPTAAADVIRRAAVAASASGTRHLGKRALYPDLSQQEDIKNLKSSSSYGSKSSKDSVASSRGSAGSSVGGSVVLVTRQPPPPPGYSLKGRGGGGGGSGASVCSATCASDIHSTASLALRPRPTNLLRTGLEAHDAVPSLPPSASAAASSSGAWCDASTVASSDSSTLFTLSLLRNASGHATSTSSFASDRRRNYSDGSGRSYYRHHPSRGDDRDISPPRVTRSPPGSSSPRLYFEEPSHVPLTRTRSHNLHPTFDFGSPMLAPSVPGPSSRLPPPYSPRPEVTGGHRLERCASDGTRGTSSSARSSPASGGPPRSPVRRPSPPRARQHPQQPDDRRRDFPQVTLSPPSGSGSARRTIEIAPGVREPLRGSDETWRAIQSGYYRPAVCVACGCGNGTTGAGSTLLVIQDARYVLCPSCKVVGPVEPEHGQDECEGGGVGIGFTHDDLISWLSGASP